MVLVVRVAAARAVYYFVRTLTTVLTGRPIPLLWSIEACLAFAAAATFTKSLTTWFSFSASLTFVADNDPRLRRSLIHTLYGNTQSTSIVTRISLLCPEML